MSKVQGLFGGVILRSHFDVLHPKIPTLLKEAVDPAWLLDVAVLGSIVIVDFGHNRRLTGLVLDEERAKLKGLFAQGSPSGTLIKTSAWNIICLPLFNHFTV